MIVKHALGDLVGRHVSYTAVAEVSIANDAVELQGMAMLQT